MDLFEYVVGSRTANRDQRRLAKLMARQIELGHPEVARSIRRRRLITWLVVIGLLMGFGFIAALTQPTPQAKHSPKKKRARNTQIAPAAPAPPDDPEISPDATPQ